MQRYWVIAPVKLQPAVPFDDVWQFDLANNLISIGWAELGDVSIMGKSQLSAAVARTYPQKPPPTQGLITNMIWNFYHEVVPGDFVIARRGRKILAAVGKVERPAFYAPGRNPNSHHCSFLEVSWQQQPRDKVFPRAVFPRFTVQSLSEDQYRSIVQGTPIVPPEVNEALEDKNEFLLQKYLEDFIVGNFDTIFKGKLTIYTDADGNKAQQFPTDAGPIDILAFEPESNSFVVIELKKGRTSDQVVGQILRYMGWLKRNLCKDGQAVKGLVICREPDPKLSYALEMTQNVDVRYCSVSFKLREMP